MSDTPGASAAVPYKLVFVHDTNQFGGLEVVMLRVLAGIDRTRFEPTLIVSASDDPYRASPPALIDRARALDVVVREIPSAPGVRGKLTELRSLVRHLRQVRPDIVHVHTSRVEGARKTIVAAALARVRVVLRTEHNSPSAFSAMPANTIRRKLFDRGIDLVLTVSEFDRTEQVRLVGRRPTHVRALLNGVDEIVFDRHSVEPRAGIDRDGSDRLVIGAVGRMTAQKGFADLIKAVAELIDRGRPVMLVLVGDGPLLAELRSLAASLGIERSVVFTGSQPDPKPYMAAMDIAVMSSLHEGLPLTLLEFMAMAIPTVVTDHPGMLEAVVEGVTSLVVPRSDPDRLADAMATLIDDPDRRHVMGAAARQHVVDHFRLKDYVTATEAIYEELLGASGTGAARPSK